MSLCHFLPILLLTRITSADFSNSFKNFVISKYGQKVYVDLARKDLGNSGSYGGGNHDGNSTTSRRAVILVHGTTNNAGTFAGNRKSLMQNGWSEETVYGTTYGSGSAAVTPAPEVSMKCEFVQQIRNMIEVVAAFTQQKVDVIGYSLGSPIARKAILGGKCVDDKNVNLGNNLTSLVETYVSVGGANKGSHLCILPITNACSINNGLFCLSSFLLDINKPKHYEGSNVYSIYGPSDDKVGPLNVCLSRNSRIDKADGEYTKAIGDHDQILRGTMDIQITFLNAH